MERKQFTFYYSFYDVIQCIRGKEQRAEAYDAICAYAFLGQLPDMDALGMGAKMVMKMFVPILSAANKKAAGGKKNARQEEDVEKMSERYDEDDDDKNKNKIKNKDKNKDKVKDNSPAQARERFDIFWDEFPKKSDREKAWQVFQGIQEPVEVLLEGLRNHKRSRQWQEDGGRFIPKADKWLSQRRWLERLPEQMPCGAKGQLGEVELSVIQAMVSEAAGN